MSLCPLNMDVCSENCAWYVYDHENGDGCAVMKIAEELQHIGLCRGD